MNRKFVVVTMVAAAAMLAGPVAYAAKPASNPTLVRAGYTKTKMVSFSLRNDSGASISVKAGDKDMTLQPGTTVSVKLAEGTQIVATNATSNYAAGSVISVVSSQLADNTLVLR
jgi:hypothetical protein